MKNSHQTFLSGVQNAPFLQNTERIFAPKKSFIDHPTAKRNALPQENLYFILQQTSILSLYQQFLGFHIEIQNLLKAGSRQQAKNCCFQFREAILEMCAIQLDSLNEKHYVSVQSEGEGEKIKQLLEEIYHLRRKVADLDGPLDIDSISSLEQCIIETPEVKSLSVPVSNETKEQGAEKQLDGWGQNINLDEAINNYLELKAVTYQLFSLSWRMLNIKMVDAGQNDLLLESLKQCYQFEVAHHRDSRRSEVAAACLDRISGLVFMLPFVSISKLESTMILIITIFIQSVLMSYSLEHLPPIFSHIIQFRATRAQDSSFSNEFLFQLSNPLLREALIEFTWPDILKFSPLLKKNFSVSWKDFFLFLFQIFSQAIHFDFSCICFQTSKSRLCDHWPLPYIIDMQANLEGVQKASILIKFIFIHVNLVQRVNEFVFFQQVNHSAQASYFSQLKNLIKFKQANQSLNSSLAS